MKYLQILIVSSISFPWLGCSDPGKGLEEELAQRETRTEGKGYLDLQAFELLGSLNEQQKNSILFQFQKKGQQEGVVAYRDRNSSIGLSTMGPDGQFSLVEIMMPVVDFVGEAAAKKNDEGAARFLECARRIAAALDPELSTRVKTWTSEKIEEALTTEDGVSMRFQDMVVKFNCFELGQVRFVNFTIGIPD